MPNVWCASTQKTDRGLLAMQQKKFSKLINSLHARQEMSTFKCAKCGLQSVGKTSQTLQARGGQHRRAVVKGTEKNAHSAKMYEHFQQRGHSVSDMRFIAIEAVQGRFKNDEDTLAVRERVWIDKLQTINYGLNTYHTT